VLFINSATLFERGRNQNTLEGNHVLKITELYKNFISVDGFSHLSTESEIKSNNYNLNIPLYVAQVQPSESISLEQALINFKDANELVKNSRELLLNEFQKWGIDASR
jgi:type I restriction enzyme M protein